MHKCLVSCVEVIHGDKFASFKLISALVARESNVFLFRDRFLFCSIAGPFVLFCLSDSFVKVPFKNKPFFNRSCSVL